MFKRIISMTAATAIAVSILVVNQTAIAGNSETARLKELVRKHSSKRKPKTFLDTLNGLYGKAGKKWGTKYRRPKIKIRPGCGNACGGGVRG